LDKVIDLLCNDGSPLGIIPDDIEGRGVGGAELAMMTLMEMLAQRGHKVRVFNDPKRPGEYNGVHYLELRAYEDRIPRDVLIIFRSPNQRYHRNQMPPEVRKIWWSTDQFTVGNFSELASQVDYCVTISPFHTDYHRSRYNIDAKKIGHIDLGVRLWEYDDEIPKVPGRMIFCSIPDRGLPVLHAAWPVIKRDAPHASLVITSDYTLWGSTANNQQHRLQWAQHAAEDVQFRGKIPRSELVKVQRQSEIMAYPSLYEELFCISAAECQVAGALPVTSDTGALVTTNEFGVIVSGNPKTGSWVENFASRITSLLTSEHDYLEQRQAAMMRGAKTRFDWQRITDRWEELFEEGKL
jgi:glycosyltransferase involved in cell wall biosynthesis